MKFLIGIGCAILGVAGIAYFKKWFKKYFDSEPEKPQEISPEKPQEIPPEKPPEKQPESQQGGIDIVSGVSVLLTCFENDQALLLEDLNLGATHTTAYDTVIVHRRANTETVAYLLPPLLEEKNNAARTWALLEGTPIDSGEDIGFHTAGHTEKVTLQAAHAKLRDAEVYIGINLAVVPLSETHREMIRTALLRLRKTFGEKLHIRKLQADELADWPTQTRNTRKDIWKQTFHSET